MSIKFIRSIFLAVAMLVGSPAVLRAAEPSKEDVAIAAKLIAAIENSDYESFVADGEAPFRQLKKEQFAAVATTLAPKLRVGYEISHLGDLRQKGYHVTLWRLRFKDESDDALATLSMKDGKVGGFFIR